MVGRVLDEYLTWRRKANGRLTGYGGWLLGGRCRTDGHGFRLEARDDASIVQAEINGEGNPFILCDTSLND